MAKKKNAFKFPYIGIDQSQEHDILYGEKGEASVLFKITNSVLQYSANSDGYLEFHQNLLNVIKILGEGHILQKTDVFCKNIFNEDIGEEFLQKKYDAHFNGRVYKVIDTYLTITKKVNGKYNQKEQDEFLNKINKIHQLLSDTGFSPTILNEKEIQEYVRRILSMNFSDEIVAMDNMKANESDLRIGNKVIKSISLIDLDSIDLPTEIAPYVERNDKEALKGFPVDTMAFLQTVSTYDTLVYNQVIEIPEQVKTLQALEKKKKRHSGIPDPANDLCVEDIELLLTDVARENQMLVNAHYNILISAEEDLVLKTINTIESTLFTQGIIPSKNSFNQLELFRSVLPGNTVELKEYDWFLTTSDASLCFFFKEALPVSEPSNFFLRFTDRQGIPLKIDPSDYPVQIGRINNRNKFVLGPSGSGKSFLMNAIVEQYMLYNTDIVIVDTGDSYSGTCSYYNGKYITYSDKKPITMNPFLIGIEEYNIEKKEFLKTLILLLWKGADGVATQVESDIINEALTDYYDTFFSESTQNFNEDSTIEEVETFLDKKGVDLKLLLEKSKIDLAKKLKTVKNHYSTLGVSVASSQNQIKKAWRGLSKQYHPDVSDDPTTHEIFTKITEAYAVLIDPVQRAKYDEENLTIVQRELEEIEENDFKNDKALMKIYFQKMLSKIEEISGHLKIERLDFNSFYEFALWRIPLIMSKDRINFDIDEFRFVLKKFYKGGEFEPILNEQAEETLFNEQFIVFEIDNIKEHKVLFPIVTLIIMDVFIQKMRLKQGQRKVLIIEEAWKAIASPMMANYILFLYKTVRKFWGEAIVVTQELGDIIGNAVVKDSIINNSDSILLLDQTKFKDNFEEIGNLLSLNEVERKKIFTINNLDNKEDRGKFKEFYFKRGDSGEVYGVEVSLFQYLTYTTEKPEKVAIETYVQNYGTYPDALEQFVEDFFKSKFSLGQFVELVNLYKNPIQQEVLKVFQELFKEHEQNTINFIHRQSKNQDVTFTEFINLKKSA